MRPGAAADTAEETFKRRDGYRRPVPTVPPVPAVPGRRRPRRPPSPPRPSRRRSTRGRLRLGDAQRRLSWALVVTAIVLSLFMGRLFQLQGVDAKGYAAAAEKKRGADRIVVAKRGAILDDAGSALATTVEDRNITADPKIISSSTTAGPAVVAARLAPLLRVDPAILMNKVTGNRRFVYLAKNVTPDIWRRIEAMRLGGIYSEEVGKRLYPGGTLAANLLGVMKSDGKADGGVESAFDGILAGKDGRMVYQRAPDGQPIPAAGTDSSPSIPGRDVQLTVDRDIQWMAQQAIAAKVAEVGAESGSVVVLQPRTGNLLAVATAPTFDANDPGSAPASAWKDRPLQESYEPGSTGKVLTAAALLEEKAITPTTPITVPKRLMRAGKSFKDWEDHGVEHLTYAGTIARSSNIGTILAAERMGLRKLYPYFRKFGIGQPTGLGLREHPGAMLPVPKWSATTGYTMAFGQGYSVNAVQMASAIGAIANDGVRVAPRLVAAYQDANGRMRPTPPSPTTRVVSEETARTVRTLMEGVVMKGGTAPKAAIEGYRVGGKTGTAQRYNARCRCYLGFTYSFIGLAPADAPQLVVAVTLQNPKSGAGGGSTAGPVFKQIMSFALQSLRIPPTGTAPPVLKLTTD